MDIRILPSNVANIIAAGEVVERPASVVKELMENALDAGADTISVAIQDAGRTLIQVIDNGCGMTPDQAVLCFERHATSKVYSPEDLENIMTFGFRGEALASIAAVSEVTLRTRQEDMEVGCEVFVSDSRHHSTVEVSCPRGANFSVRNLFYNVPARRKFLKSDNVEMNRIVTAFIRVALTRPDVNFSLTHNGRNVFVLKRAKSLKFRVLDLLGSSVVNEVVDLKAETSVVRISGYVGRPDSAKKSQTNQYFFVNGRFFRSPYLHKAVMKAYEHMVPEGAKPSYFIYLEVDPHSIDVNIDPAKTEVKFEEDSVIFQILYAGIREALGKNSFGDAIDFDREGVPEMPVLSKEKLSNPVDAPFVSVDPTFNPFDNDGFPSEASPYSNDVEGTSSFPEAGVSFGTAPMPSSMSGMSQSSSGMMPSSMPGMSQPSSGVMPSMSGMTERVPIQSMKSSMLDIPGLQPTMSDMQQNQQQKSFIGGGFGPASSYVDRKEDYGRLFEEKTLPSTQMMICQGKYIITSVKSGVMIINIRRAKERILFEGYMKALSMGGTFTQTALFPVHVPIGVDNMYLISEHHDLLTSLGFDIGPFGNDTIVVNGVPQGYSCDEDKVRKMVYDLLAAISDDSSSVRGSMLSSLSDKFARLGAINAAEVKTTVEAQRLIDDLFSCENSEFTNSGRRIITIVSVEEIDKKF